LIKLRQDYVFFRWFDYLYNLTKQLSLCTQNISSKRFRFERDRTDAGITNRGEPQPEVLCAEEISISKLISDKTVDIGRKVRTFAPY
jgi:hypothetical protein